MPSNPNRAPNPRRATVAVALAATAAIGASSLTGPANAALPAVPKAAAGDVVVEWNRTLLSLVQTAGAQPATIQPTRDFAVMSAAVYDAVDAIDPHHSQYLLHLKVRHGASPVAAAAKAAHDVLIAMFPTFKGTLDRQLASDFAAIPPNQPRTDGAKVGAQAAADLLQIRATDGSASPPPPYQSTGATGDFRPTPPGFAEPVFTQWGAVRPFVLRRSNQFRPPPPPALSSRAYATSVNEVKSLGQDPSTSRTAEQTAIGKFWSAPIQNYWNAIAGDVSVARRDDIDTSARTFALLDLGLAEGSSTFVVIVI
jgi:hypothetical protein